MVRLSEAIVVTMLLASCARSHERVIEDGGTTADAAEHDAWTMDARAPIDAASLIDTASLIDVGPAEDAFVCGVEACDGFDDDCDGLVDELAPCALPNASAICVDATCRLDACDERAGDCDGDPSNGCEAVFATDHDHCGACDVACRPSDVCEDGECVEDPFVVVAAPTGAHSCVCLASGRVLCWGRNDPEHRQLGMLPPDLLGLPPTVMEGVPPCASVTVSLYGTCVVDREGGVWCWGDNTAFAAGGPDEWAPVIVPTHIEGLPPVRRVAGHLYTYCAASEDATWCWGANMRPFRHPDFDTWRTPVRFDTGPIVDLESLGSDLIAERPRAVVFVARSGAGVVTTWGFGDVGPARAIVGEWVEAPFTVALRAPSIAIDTNDLGACSLGDEGTIECWRTTAPTVVPERAPLVSLGTPGGSSLAQRVFIGESMSGQVLSWGHGDQSGHLPRVSAPAPIPGLDGFHVSVASLGALAWRNEPTRELMGWGGNISASIAPPRGTLERPISVGSF